MSGPAYTSGYAFGNGFTAPSNGWIYLGGVQDGSTSITINGVGFEVLFDTGDGQSRGNMFMPVSQGDVIAGFYRLREARFFPATGSTANSTPNRAFLPIIKYRVFGSYQEDAIQTHYHLVFAKGGEGGSQYSLNANNYAKESGVHGVTDYKYTIVGVSTYPTAGRTASEPREARYTSENRSKNRAYLPIIKF